MKRYNLFVYGKVVYSGTSKQCAEYLRKQDKLITASIYSIAGKISQMADLANRSVYGHTIRSI